MRDFIDFIKDELETPGGGALLREYLACKNADELRTFFTYRSKEKNYYIDEKGQVDEKGLEKLIGAKEHAKYLSLDYEYINGKGMSY
jgi:hypothetical protein